MMFACYIHRGRNCYQTNVEAETAEEAAERARVFMLQPFWRGPKPKPGDRLRVLSVYSRDRSDERWVVLPVVP